MTRYKSVVCCLCRCAIGKRFHVALSVALLLGKQRLLREDHKRNCQLCVRIPR